MAKPSSAGARFRPATTAGAFSPNSDAQSMVSALGVPHRQPEATPVLPSSFTEAHSLSASEGAGAQVISLSRIRESELNARFFYSTEEVDEMASSLTTNGQDVSVVGYWDGDHIVLIDGVKRLRGAKSAGLDNLRVDVVPRPQNERDIYLTSRRINQESSSQTALDDCIRFRALLEKHLFDSQDALGDALGMSKASVSKVLALESISDRVMRRLKDTNIPSSIKALYAISRIYSKTSTDHDKTEEAEDLAFSIVEEAVKKDLSGNQVEQLVESRLKGPSMRVRNEVRQVTIGSAKGTIKFNKDKGRLDFAISGLDPTSVDELLEKVENLCKQSLVK